jgi:hypothetical protein
VTGRVVDPDGKPATDCVVTAPWHVGVAPVRTDAAGGFALTLPAAPEGTPTRVRFSAPGYGVVERALSEPDDAAIGSVRLGEGRDVSGRVVDPQGTGVAGFTVVLENEVGPSVGRGYFDTGREYFVGHEDPREDGGPLVGFAVTDREGAFRIRGIAGDPGTARGHGDGWMLNGAQRVRTGDANLLHAVPVVTTRVRLEPPDGTRLPAEWRLAFSSEDHGGERRLVTGAEVTIRWSRGEGHPGDLRAEFGVFAEGFEAVHREVVVPAEERRRDVEFRLRAVQPATLVVTLVTSDAAFARRPFDLETYDPDARAQVARVHAEALPDGRLRASVTPGRWWLRLRPADGWCNPVFWEGEQTLAEGRENPLVWNVPPHGGAVLRLPNRSPQDRRGMEGRLILTAEGSEGAGLPLEWLGAGGEAADRTLVQALPVGPCRVVFDLLDAEGQKTSTTVFVVHPGEVSDVLLEAPSVPAPPSDSRTRAPAPAPPSIPR